MERGLDPGKISEIIGKKLAETGAKIENFSYREPEAHVFLKPWRNMSFSGRGLSSSAEIYLEIVGDWFGRGVLPYELESAGARDDVVRMAEWMEMYCYSDALDRYAESNGINVGNSSWCEKTGWNSYWYDHEDDPKEADRQLEKNTEIIANILDVDIEKVRDEADNDFGHIDYYAYRDIKLRLGIIMGNKNGDRLGIPGNDDVSCFAELIIYAPECGDYCGDSIARTLASCDFPMPSSQTDLENMLEKTLHEAFPNLGKELALSQKDTVEYKSEHETKNRKKSLLKP